MDPWVRAFVAVQRAVGRVSAAALAVAFGSYLVLWASDPPRVELSLGVLALGLGSTVAALVRRWRRIGAEEAPRLDAELFSHLVVLVYAIVLQAPGGLDGPTYPLVYALMMLVAAFARPAGTLVTVAFAVLLESALQMVALRRAGADALWPHSALIGLFALLNLLVFRGEIARIRALSRNRIEGEIQRMREAARSYRLIGAPSSTSPQSLRAPPQVSDEERLLRSGVDEIHQAVQFALDLLRQTLSLRTAVLLWLDQGGARLHIQEISTSEDAIEPGPFSARDGIVAAALTRGLPVSMTGAKAAQHVPYYAVSPVIGSLSGVPVLEHGHARGVLVVDRESRAAFSESDEQLLIEATRFLQRAIENERVFIQLERAKSEQGKLYRATDALAGATTEAAVIEAGVSSAREIAAFDFAVVTLFHKNQAEHEICAASGQGTEQLCGQRFRHNQGLVSMVVAHRHPLPYRGDYDPSKQVVFTRRLAPPATPSLLVLPLCVHERALGTLVLGASRRGAFGEAVRPTLEVLSSHIAVSLANARMVQRLEELATTDGLTSLLNKRALMDLAAQKIKSAKRFQKPLSLLICDLDHFKKVNDTHGHDVGDVVIRGFADVLRRAKRDTDLVARFGGEEFVLVCEETDAHGAALLAERVRAELEVARFHTDQGPLGVTCSVGIATFPGAGQDWEGLFKATDEALYASKRGGRNRVTAWSPRVAGAAA